jgi:ribosome-associated protein YbcJ (S4-like RNA binding protein)
MKGQELYSRLVNFGDLEDKDTETVCGWIDTCQKDIAIDFGPIASYTFATVTSGVRAQLPSNFLSISEVLVNGEEYTKKNKIKIYPDGYIVFPEDLTQVLLIYRSIPEDYTDLNEELRVHPLIQPHILNYLIAMHYDGEGEGDEESTMATKYMSLWEAKKREVLGKLANADIDGPVETVDAMPRRSRYFHSIYEEEDDE